MANSFDSALVVDTVSSMVKTLLADRLAPLRVFSANFSDEVKKAADTIQVPLVSAASETLVDPTDFSTLPVTSVGKVPVTLQHIVQKFHITNGELASGHKLQTLVRANMNKLAVKLWSLAITPITTPNFGEATATPGEISPGSTKLQALWSAISKSPSKGLVLAPEVYAKFIPTSTTSLPLANGAYGFDNGIHLATSFAGAVSGLDGFACDPDAIAIAAAQPVFEEAITSNFIVTESVVLPDLGMTVYFNVWGDTATRAIHASMETMFGAAKGNATGTMALII